MISSLGALLRISLRRSRSDWPIVLAAGWFCLLAAALLAAGAMYATAVSTAGLQRVLADAPVAEANIEVRLRVPSDLLDDADAAVGQELQAAIEPPGGTLLRTATSDTFALPDQPADEVRNLTVVAHAEGLAEQATLIDGEWPDDRSADGPLPVAVVEDVALALGRGVGDELHLRGRLDATFGVDVRIVGVFRIDDPADPSWWDEPQAVQGVVESERFVTFGPLYTTARHLLRAAPASLDLAWHAYPDVGALTLDAAADLEARVAGLGERLRATLASIVAARPAVTTELPALLAGAQRSLLVSRAGVLLLSVQLVVLAAYAVLLSAGLLMDRRRLDTAMLRSRGAGRRHLLVLAGIEAALLCGVAAAAAPWLAAVGLGAFNVAGPLADIGLRIEPRVSVDAYLAGAAAALLCFAALTLPTLRGGRALSSVQGDKARGPTTGLGQRLGLDVALLAVAGVGLWQLRHYGAPLTRTVQGTLGLDPLLVATPAIGLLAGGVIALRIVPLVALLMERLTVSVRGLVPTLGARQLARRPLRYTRSALLLMLAVALGIFSVSYTWTWTSSQRDQAAFQVGTDVRVTPGTRAESMPRWALDAAYATVPGVEGRVPVDHDDIRLPGSDRTARIVAIDAAAGGAVTRLRADLADGSPEDLLEPLAAAAPEIEAVALPGEPTVLRARASVAIKTLERQELDAATDTLVFVPAEPAEIRDWRGLGLAVVVRDARGLLHRFAADLVPIAAGPQVIEVALGDQVHRRAFAWPLQLLALEVPLSLPEGYQAPEATIALGGVEVAGADGAWQPVDLALATGWRTTSIVYGQPHQDVAVTNWNATLEATTGVAGFRLLPGLDGFGRGASLTFAPAELDRLNDMVVPVVAGDAFLDATAGAVGVEQDLTIDGVRRTIMPIATMRAIPTTDPDTPAVLMDLSTLGLLRFEGNDAVDAADEWWLAVAPEEQTSVAATLRAAPFASWEVATALERGRALATDPVALGIIGALAIGFVAAALFAVVGFMVSAAVSARERVAEFALLRALGLSARQLSVWLSLENAVLAVVSLVAGTVLGLVIAWVVLPFITVTQGAQTPFPPVVVDVPWTAVAVLEGASLVALAGTVLVLAWLLRRAAVASILRIGEE